MNDTNRRRERAELALLVVFVIFAVIGIWRHDPDLTDFGLLGALSTFVLYLWQRRCLAHLTYERIVNETRAGFGDRIHVRFELTNDKILPLPWVNVIDHFPRGLFPHRPPVLPSTALELPNRVPASPIRMILRAFFAAEPERVIAVRLQQTRSDLEATDLVEYRQSFSILPFQSVDRTITVECTRRGRHRFGDSLVTSGDPFGIRQRTLRVSHHHEVVVYPKIFSLSMQMIPSRTFQGDERSRRHHLGDPARVAGMRPYRVGDPLRHVDWRTTARRGELLVRDFEPTFTVRLELFIDCVIGDLEDRSTNSPHEFAIALGASLVARYVDQSTSVGLHINATALGKPVSDAPAPGQRSAIRLLEQLALVAPDTSRSFADLVRDEGARVGWQSTVIVVTSDFTPELLARIAELRRRAPVLALHLVGLGGSQPPDSLVDGAYRVQYRPSWLEDARVVIA